MSRFRTERKKEQGLSQSTSRHVSVCAFMYVSSIIYTIRLYMYTYIIHNIYVYVLRFMYKLYIYITFPAKDQRMINALPRRLPDNPTHEQKPF